MLKAYMNSDVSLEKQPFYFLAKYFLKVYVMADFICMDLLDKWHTCTPSYNTLF